jgi:MATE family multidrug resistance protein
MNPRPPATRASGVRADATAILTLGLPLLVNNLALAGMSVADTVMGGRLGGQALAAIAVGVSYYQIFMISGLGIMMALSPLVAHAYGSGDDAGVGDYARHGAVIGGVLTLVLVAGLVAVGPVLALIGTAPAIIPDAVGFVHSMAFGIPAFVGFQALRFVSEGTGRTQPMMVVAVLGLAFNVFANWVFMYGRLGMPALGPVGTGVATALVWWVMFAALAAYVARHPAYRPYAIFRRPRLPTLARSREILGLGLPFAGSMLAEGGLFSAAGLMIGTLGATRVAAHQIALNYAALMFMAPLAFHSATTICVGHALGRGAPAAARRAGFVGIALCGSLMLLSAIVIAFGSEAIAALYTTDAEVRRLAAGLLLYAALFQLSDGLQVGAAGALRGFKDARVPLVIAIAAYWGVGFPLAFVLGVVRGGGPASVWIGLIAGLTVCALALNGRYLWLTAPRRQAARARL